MLTQSDLFTSGTGGYHTYRIPSLLIAANGDVLAFCEGRVAGGGDAGEIEILMRRSSDGGQTWGKRQRVVAEGGMTCGNNCPVVDRASGDIVMLFCKNLADGGEKLISAGEAPRTVWVMRSGDHGATWSVPVEITESVKKSSWSWYATGPGHAIQLESGRILVPADHNVLVNGDKQDPYHSHVIYSDDGGHSWSLGGIVSLPSNESCAVELTDGRVYLNCRTRRDKARRVGAISRDGGLGFLEEWYHRELPEPTRFRGGCEGSLVRYSDEVVLFCNPATASKERSRLTARTSRDECRTWSSGRVICEGISAYSDMAVLPDGTILCLYERGEKHYSETLTLARFDLEWIEES